eukprot:1011668-Pelagomonas_calceolata.AAC.3
MDACMFTCLHPQVVEFEYELVEESEYELEELGLGGGKKNRKPPPRVAELEEIVGRHKEHMGRLEKVLRCIDNETIHPDELEDLKSDMEMYLVGGPEVGHRDGDGEWTRKAKIWRCYGWVGLLVELTGRLSYRQLAGLTSLQGWHAESISLWGSHCVVPWQWLLTCPVPTTV